VPTSITNTESRSLRDLLLPALALAVLATLVALVFIGEHGVTADLLRTIVKQSGTDVDGNDFSVLWDTGTKLLPLGLLMCVSIFPIAGIAGGVMMALGNKKGLQIIGFAGGACIFVSVLGAIAN